MLARRKLFCPKWMSYTYYVGLSLRQRRAYSSGKSKRRELGQLGGLNFFQFKTDENNIHYFNDCNVSFKRHCISSILDKSTITNLSQHIDLERLKLEYIQDKKLRPTGECFTIHQMLDDIMEMKCQEVISGLTPQQSRLFKAIQLEHCLLYAEGHSIIAPDQMSYRALVEAMTYASKEERQNFYSLLEYIAQTNAERVVENRLTERLKLEDGEDSVVDGESDQSFIFHDPNSPTIWGDNLLSSAMLHGVPLVFDMCFDDDMNPREIRAAAKQLGAAYCVNQSHPHPFHFVFTNCLKSNILFRTFELQHLLPCEHTLFSSTDQDHTLLYDRSQLIYLSPYAKQTLHHFDPSKVYVISAYSDVMNRKKLGPARAKEQGIKCLKFPIDENIRWVQGAKDLHMQAAVKILLSAKDNEQWRDAFQSAIPPKNFTHYS